MEDLGRLEKNEVSDAPKKNIIIILDDVRSMQNVGAIFRTADAFAVKEIYLCGYTPIPPHRDIHKTALGATETVHWRHFETITDAIGEAKSMGFTIAAVEQTHNSTALNEYPIDAHQKVALIFGNEVNGVSDLALKHCDSCIEIPQWGSKHSLNISVSVGVVVWEFAQKLVLQ